MIRFKFCPECKIKLTEHYELNSYKEFFLFYQANFDKGVIFDVADDGETGEK